ncbi:MAG: c-type cytochrome [Alphaproteobacteria bacterium]|nr:c-type cytochrome [Alphaproteobacteria bacterium]
MKSLIAAACACTAAFFAATAVALGADADRGQQLWESRCFGCHGLDGDRVGPRHRGVVGRKAGSVPGYAYSAALKGATVVWDAKSLDAWLTNPQAFLPGQKMNVRVNAAEDRADIIAYLAKESAKR